MTAALRDRKGVWIGWSGETGPPNAPDEHQGVRLRAIELDGADIQDFYLGFSNATLWPLYHDAVRPPTYHRQWWHRYRDVNSRFADEIASVAAPGATVWVHDYQLQLVPAMLRKRRPDVRIGFFLHIPFPPLELFMQLPWRREILEGLLGADVVGLQVQGAAANFARLARRLSGARGTNAVLEHNGRVVQVGAFPISVDVERLAGLASQPSTQARAEAIRSELGDPEVLLLGVDRLDYTKGIEHRMRAISELFSSGKLEAGRHVMVQVAVPSRESDGHYLEERHHLEQVVGEVNGDHGVLGRPAVHYLHQSLGLEELVAMYVAADVMLVTPFRDGMNLVAKEYVTCRSELTGALVLSEFAGAAAELRGAILVNPHDLDDLELAICRAVEVSGPEARRRMVQMRRALVRNAVHQWSRSFLDALADRDQLASSTSMVRG